MGKAFSTAKTVFQLNSQPYLINLIKGFSSLGKFSIAIPSPNHDALHLQAQSLDFKIISSDSWLFQVRHRLHSRRRRGMYMLSLALT